MLCVKTRLVFFKKKKLRTIAQRIKITRLEHILCFNFAIAETTFFHFFMHFKLGVFFVLVNYLYALSSE